MAKPRLKGARHYCEQCRDWTEHEREETLPAQYRQSPDSAFYDPDYEDRGKCGRCGEYYQCGECGAPWNVDAEECEEVLDHGYHGNYQGPLCQVIADGIPWEDSNGTASWPEQYAIAEAAAVEAKGYEVEVRKL